RRTHSVSQDANVLLLDSIGELAACYELADIVFIGGTLSSGGHNPIEPAYFGKAIVTGPHFQSLRAIYEAFIKQDAILISNDLERDVERLLSQPDLRRRLGQAAEAIVKQNAGSTEIVMEKLRTYLHGGRVVEPRAELSVR